MCGSTKEGRGVRINIQRVHCRSIDITDVHVDIFANEILIVFIVTFTVDDTAAVTTSTSSTDSSNKRDQKRRWNIPNVFIKVDVNVNGGRMSSGVVAVESECIAHKRVWLNCGEERGG